MPRPAGHTISVCGVRTAFRMPDVVSIGLGGGSHVVWHVPARTAGAEPANTAGATADASRAGAAAAHTAGGAAANTGAAPHTAGTAAAPPHCTVGPQSVGSRLSSEALVQGGSVCTATDVAVLLGHMRYGTPGLVGEGAPEGPRLEQAWQVRRCEE